MTGGRIQHHGLIHIITHGILQLRHVIGNMVPIFAVMVRSHTSTHWLFKCASKPEVNPGALQNTSALINRNSMELAMMK